MPAGASTALRRIARAGVAAGALRAALAGLAQAILVRTFAGHLIILRTSGKSDDEGLPGVAFGRNVRCASFSAKGPDATHRRASMMKSRATSTAGLGPPRRSNSFLQLFYLPPESRDRCEEAVLAAMGSITIRELATLSRPTWAPAAGHNQVPSFRNGTQAQSQPRPPFSPAEASLFSRACRMPVRGRR